MLQIELNSDLKEQQVLVYIIWAGNVTESAEICSNVGKYALICVALLIYLNKRETLVA